MFNQIKSNNNMKNMKEVKSINISHPTKGNIVVFQSEAVIKGEFGAMIGDVVTDHSPIPYIYHAKITKNKDNYFNIIDLKVIKPDAVIVGFMDNSKGCQNYITVIKNIDVTESMMVFPSGVLSVTYS